MADVFTPAKRSQVMARIRSQDTKPELAVRRSLHRLGYRFRLHDPRLPGRPDIVLKKHRLMIEVKGCFWHSHRCLKGRLPVGNPPIGRLSWSATKQRDRQKARLWRALGWRVATVWECDVRRLTPEDLARRLSSALRLTCPGLERTDSSGTPQFSDWIGHRAREQHRAALPLANREKERMVHDHLERRLRRPHDAIAYLTLVAAAASVPLLVHLDKRAMLTSVIFKGGGG